MRCPIEVPFDSFIHGFTFKANFKPFKLGLPHPHTVNVLIPCKGRYTALKSVFNGYSPFDASRCNVIIGLS